MIEHLPRPNSDSQVLQVFTVPEFQQSRAKPAAYGLLFFLDPQMNDLARTAFSRNFMVCDFDLSNEKYAARGSKSVARGCRSTWLFSALKDHLWVIITNYDFTPILQRQQVSLHTSVYTINLESACSQKRNSDHGLVRHGSQLNVFASLAQSYLALFNPSPGSNLKHLIMSMLGRILTGSVNCISHSPCNITCPASNIQMPHAWEGMKLGD